MVETFETLISIGKKDSGEYITMADIPPAFQLVESFEDWYNEKVYNYELSGELTEQLIKEDIDISRLITAPIDASIQLSPFVGVDYKQSILNILNNIKTNNYSVFVENDISSMLDSNKLIVINFTFSQRMNCIVECYIEY